MEIGKQIKKHRLELKLSQDDLAEKIFVTRQTISNWENDKNYPDIKSLLLLSNLFGVSLDILVKGDLKEMKEKINEDDIRKFKNNGTIYGILLVASIVLAVPLTYIFGITGWIIWMAIYAITMFYSVRVWKLQKTHNIKTYREIVAFTEGRTLDELEKSCEKGKRPYQEILFIVGTGAIAVIVARVAYYFLSNI